MDKNYYQEYYYLERSHWWFRARLNILESLFRKNIANNFEENLSILNAGVATGATTIMLEKFGTVKSLEYNKDCCEFLERNTDIKPVNASLTALPFKDKSFDVVCAFDVIEHIEDDVLAIQEIRRVLKDNGKVFLTVPAFMFLWSKHDVINHHFRRYTRKTLSTLVMSEYKIAFISYYNFFFFIPVAAIRFVLNMFRRAGSKQKKESNQSTGSDFELFKTEGFLNKTLTQIFKSEKFWLTNKRKFPFGISLVCIGEKD